MSAKFGCYSLDLEANPYSREEIQVPLKNFSYDIELSDSLAFLELQQTYVNTLKKTLDVLYIFPINPSAAIYNFQISFGGRTTRGVVKSKTEAEAEFKDHQDEGREAGYVSYNASEGKDVMKVRLGNISPGQEIKVKISYIHTVSVVLNSFYEFRLNTTITPRYVSKLEPSKVVFREHFDKQVEGVCSWFLRIRIKSSRQIKACFSKTHAINPNLKPLDKNSWEVLIQQKEMFPNKDFVLDYSFEDMDKPSVLLGESDNQTQAVVSFVPRFGSLSPQSAKKYAIQSKEIPLPMSKIKAEYVFFLDRSGSMGGQRISKAKQALVVFLKSLPTDSFFNVVSFGSDYQLLYPESQKYAQEIIMEAIQKIDAMDANMGGTEILYPLRMCLQKPPIEDYPRQIFLLTDGAVSDTASVQNFVRNHNKFSRVHGIGIGNGASEDLILGCAQQGKGYSVMISDTEDPTDKIIDILDKSLSPAISKIQLNFDKERVESVVPNPEKNPYILKNEVANFYFTFHGKLTSLFPVNISFTDSLGVQYSQPVVINPQSAIKCAYLTKVVGHHSLNALYTVYKYGQSQEDHLYYVKQVNKEELQATIIKQSIQKQILCQLTAFICVNESMPDAVSKERMKQPKQSIKINPMNPADHLKVLFGSDNLYWDDSSDDCIIDECAFVQYPEGYYQRQEREAQVKHIPLAMPKESKHVIKSIDLKKKSTRQIPGVRNKEIKKITVLQIIKLQNANGMWSDDELLSKLFVPQELDLIKAAFSKFSKEIWTTLAVVEQIKTLYFSTDGKKVLLILRKAQQFIDRHSSEGFSELERVWSQKVRSVERHP